MNQPNTLVLSGALQINRAEEIARQLKELLASENDLSLNLSKVKAVDLSFVQLLASFRSSAQKAGKNLNLNFDLDEQDQKLLTDAGFAELFDLL